MRSIRRYVLVGFAAAMVAIVAFTAPLQAQAPPAAGAFSVQVSPSPLVATLKPGEVTTLEIKVRNGGPAPENLKIAPRSFRINPNGGEVHINETQEPELAKWLRFSPQTFTVASGQTTTVKVTITVPKEAGFSYSFALVINRTVDAPEQKGARTLKASIAIFSLLNIDRPGAVRQLEVSKFGPTQTSYEYLPAEFEIELKNTGNTIVQPAGNVFIQRGSNDPNPIATLLVNDGGSYILPGTSRTLKAQWTEGFPVFTQKTHADGSAGTELTWDWNKVSQFRFGQYTAKLVAVYDDGHRDVPLQAEATFWVFPWVILLAVLAVLALVGFGLWSFASKVIGLGKRIKPKKKIHL
jgi:hypothetical protein